MSEQKKLDIRNLTIEFLSGDRYLPAVTDISFHLNKGEILALVGESGCGKSVSCMSLARLLPVPPARILRGEILLTLDDGSEIDVLKLTPRELKKIRGGEIAYIFQEPSVSLNPVFRVGNQIAEAIELHRPDVEDPRGEVIELLKQVGIPAPEERADLYPHEMSGGMQQRVMIAMALASRPSVLIADEPTTALDVTIQAQILELLSEVRKKFGMSIILVTHNLGIVSEMADRVCVMYAGRIVESAPVRELIDSPRHPYTASLLKAVPELGRKDDILSTIPGSVPLPADFPPGCRFCERCGLRKSFSPSYQLLCEQNIPPMKEIAPGHFCACHFAGEKKA